MAKKVELPSRDALTRHEILRRIVAEMENSIVPRVRELLDKSEPRSTRAFKVCSLFGRIESMRYTALDMWVDDSGSSPADKVTLPPDDVLAWREELRQIMKGIIRVSALLVLPDDPNDDDSLYLYHSEVDDARHQVRELWIAD